MDPKGKGMVVNNNEKESIFNEPKDDKPTDSGSGHKRKDGKKKTRRIKEIVYYDSDESSSSQKDDDDYEKKKTVNSNFSFDYSRIPQSTNAHLLSIPLDKPPHFGKTRLESSEKTLPNVQNEAKEQENEK